MGNFTPIYGWPYQSLTDPPDGADLGENLALNIESTLNGLITGSVGGPIAALQASMASLQADTAHMGCRLRRAAGQPVNTGAPAVFTFDTEDEDTDGMWTPSAPTLITIPANGTWMITYFMSLANTPAIVRNLISVYITSSVSGHQNGAGGVPSLRSNYVTQETYISVSGAFDLNAGDVITCDIYHTVGTTQNAFCWVNVHRINKR